MNHHSLAVEHVAKSFPTADQPLQVLRDVSLSLTSGDSVAIVGPSGSGKSTLLQILGTLDRPDRGSVAIDGQDPFALGEGDLARFRNQNIGFVFQDHHLLPQLTVIENVLVPTLASGKPNQEMLPARGMTLPIGRSVPSPAFDKCPHCADRPSFDRSEAAREPIVREEASVSICAITNVGCTDSTR